MQPEEFINILGQMMEGRTYKLELTDSWSKSMRSVSIQHDILWVVLDVTWDYNSTGFVVEHVGSYETFAEALVEWGKRIDEAYARRDSGQLGLPSPEA